MSRYGLALSLCFLLTSLTLAQKPPTHNFRTPPNGLSMPMVAPLFLDDKDFSSTVTLVNDAIAQMSARVVVLDSQGAQVAFKEVVMPGHTSLAIQIHDLLTEAGSAANSGSVLVIPEPVSGMPIGAQLSIESKIGATPAYMEEEMLPQDEGRQGIYRASTLGVKGSPILALKSFAQGVQSVTLECFSERKTPTKGTVELHSGELLLVAACDSRATGRSAVFEQMTSDRLADRGSVGVSVISTATPGDLVAFGFALYHDERGPYFSSLNFTNPTVQASPSTIFAGVPTGAAALFSSAVFRPEVAVSNFSAKPAQVSVTLAHTIGGKTSTELVQKLVLAGQSSRTVQIPAHGDPAMTNSLIVSSSLPPGEVVAQFAAWGDTVVRAIELQGKDAASAQNGGGHPWDIRGGTTSTLFLFSHGADGVKKIDVQISSGSEFWWKSYRLAPMETKAININDIVTQGVADDKGSRISKTALQGQVAWFAGFPKWGKGRVMQSRPSDGLARSFSCGTCTTDCNHGTMSPHSSVTVAVGGSDYLGDIQLQNCSISCLQFGCGSTVLGPSTPSATRWSPPDGTVNYIGKGGLLRFSVAGTSPGSGGETWNAQDDAGQANECWAAGSGSVTVADATPILSGIYPGDWNSGATTPSVTISGQYFGTNAPTLSFSPGAGITYSLVSYNDTQIVANITVASGTPNEDVDVSVTNNGYGGSGFLSGGGSVPTSAPVHATVHAPINSPEVTVIAWVNGSAPDLNPLPSGANQYLVTQLNSSPGSCAALVTLWAVFGIPKYLQTSPDTAYANAWLVKFSANTAPPPTITPATQYSGGNYRLFDDFGNGKGGYNVGVTPDPCNTGFIPNWLAAGEASQYMGASGTSPSGKVYQLAEGRVGKVGQAGSQTINNGRTVPWIWSAIEFNLSGNPTYSDVGMFPTYSVYVNGSLVKTYAQSPVANFIAKDQTYQRTPSQIQ